MNEAGGTGGSGGTRGARGPAGFPAEDRAAREIEILFRRESGRIVSGLCRVFGAARLEMAEDVVQETTIRALRSWRFGGVPDDPAAWMARTARNLAIDRLRRDRWLRRREDALRGWGLGAPREAETPGRGARFEGEISDDQLAMVFLSCHPRVPRGSRVAMTLRAVAGFTAEEIAAALLTTPAAVAQGLARAKRVLRRGRLPFSMPTGRGLCERADAVLDALYVMFGQGYHAARGWALIRRDVCEEALRLAEAVAAHPAAATPAARALCALFYFHAARFPARVGANGELILLRDQDRSRYDRALLVRGLSHLEASADGDRLTAYHLEADIASCHSLAESYEATDWTHILECYDGLARLNPSPTVAVNRAVALARVEGPQAALAALEPLRALPALRDYLPLYLALAACHEACGRHARSRSFLLRALALEMSAPTGRHVRRALEN